MRLQDQVKLNIPLGKLFTSLEDETVDLTKNSLAAAVFNFLVEGL